MKPDRRTSDTRTKILEIAETEFAQDGYAGAHLQHIASQVGVQKTALYYYFPSKAALYEAVLARMLTAFDAAIADALGPSGGPEERFARLLDAMNDLLAEKRNYARILMRIFVDQNEIPTGEIAPLVETVIGRLLTFFKEGKDAGVFIDASVRHMLLSSLGAVVFYYATDNVGAAIVGVDDLFTRSSVAWRREEVRRLALRATLKNPPA